MISIKLPSSVQISKKTSHNNFYSFLRLEINELFFIAMTDIESAISPVRKTETIIIKRIIQGISEPPVKDEKVAIIAETDPIIIPKIKI
jgi:hypothetical protein